MLALHRLKEHPQSVFTLEDVAAFPALRSRNFWCIQRHQATGTLCVIAMHITQFPAHHYDLRMHLHGQLVSWAIPKGVLGFTVDEKDHLAVETPLHPLSHAVREGPEGRQGAYRGTRKTQELHI